MRVSRVEAVGAALFVGLAAWVTLAGAVVGGHPVPMVAIVLATGAAAFVARAVSDRHPTVVPGLVAIVVAGYLASFGGDVTSNLSGPLGYKNAAAALCVAGAAAAGLVVLRDQRLVVRVGFAVLGLALAALPWFSDVRGGIGTGTAVVLATVLLGVGRRPHHRWLLPLAVAAAVAALTATVVVGILYGGDGEGDRAGALTERRLVLWSDAVDLVAAEPLFGVGPGRFAMNSPTALADRDARWAHHEPLEVAAEAGIPAGLLLVGLVLWGFAWLHAGTARRGAGLVAVLLAGAFAHACIDYVWHFPAVPMAVAAVVGAGVAGGRLPSMTDPGVPPTASKGPHAITCGL